MRENRVKVARLILMIMLVLLPILTTGVSVYASTEVKISGTSDDLKMFKETMTSKYAGDGASSSVFACTGSSNTGTLTIKFNESKFATLSDEEKEECVSLLSNTSLYSKFDSTSRQEIINSISATSSSSAITTLLFGGTKANYGKAYEIFMPFNGVIGTLMGLGVLFISMCLGLFIVTDICFLTIPPFQNMKLENSDNKNFFCGIVSREAVIALKEANEKNNGKGIVLISYAKHRTLMIFALALCMLYLVDGSILTIVNSFMDLVKGLKG